jgi:malate dehydrogenase (oxaloacetate-decarboxylating)
MFCSCESCKNAIKAGGRNIRTRSQAVVDDKLLIDFPADTYMHVLYSGLELTKINSCIITHNHSDHLYAADFEMRRRGFAYLKSETPLTVYGTAPTGKDTEEIIKTIVNIAPAFGGINLEDISAPRCFEIEERLKGLLDIPVFHEDQHGTAIVVLAGAINALKVTGKTKESCKVIVNGAGSAGIAIAKLLLSYGFCDATLCDINGIISKDYKNLNWMQKQMLEVTSLSGKNGTLADALVGADLFVGVSAPNIVTKEMVQSMNKDAIIFAMANPIPEIMPELAKQAGAKVVATGRSDYPNQVNNVVAFPGIFSGALEGRATQITEEMKLAAAAAIAGLVSDDELNEDYIMPHPFDPRVKDAVSNAVKLHIKR